MVRICFVLDLRTLPPPILEDLKKSLMMLGNYHALSLPNCDDSSGTTESKPLVDQIGVYYIFTDFSCLTDEVLTAYNPEGDFNLRTFHHALNTLPSDNFSPDLNQFQSLFCQELKLEEVIDDVILSSWKVPEMAIKIILICSCFVETLDQETRDSILDSMSRNVSFEFVFLERKASLFGDITVNINHIENQIGDRRNCKFSTCVPDLHVLSGFAKRWFQELKIEKEEQLQAHFTFKINLLGSLNQLSCNLYTYFNPIIDGFFFCKACRCHGIQLGHSKLKLSQKPSRCPITEYNLGTLDIWENSVKIGEQTNLYLPSFYNNTNHQKVSSPINFNVIQRTELGSLSEGVIIGPTYVLTPSISTHMDRSKLNNQVFQAVSGLLNSLDQGLVCSTNCNLETLMETTFKCYYILLPSGKGSMILKRLLASEEYLPFPDPINFIHRDESEEIKNTVQESLLKIEINKYDPLQHERGFHQKLNLLVKHSLFFRKRRPRPVSSDESPEPDLNLQDTSSGGADRPATGEGTSQIAGEEEIAASLLTREWEQIAVEELPDSGSLPRSSNSDRDQLDTSPLENSKKLDEITPSFLERMQIPRENKRKAVSTSSSVVGDVHPPAKRPRISVKNSKTTDVHGPVAADKTQFPEDEKRIR